jgi:AraC-like DNA-binding protein
VEVSPGYHELPPPRALRGALECLWVRAVPPDGAPPVQVLPDGCSDLMWRTGRGGFVAGPDTGPNPAALAAGTVVVGARFLPGAGGPAFGLPLEELRDSRVETAELWAALDRQLPPTLDPAEALARIAAIVGRLVASRPPDLAVREAARRLADPRARVRELPGDLGLSERQLRRRCHTAAGYGPKTLQRVLRFRRFLAGIDASDGSPDLAWLAADAGYADQAHLTRDVRRLAGVTPTELASLRGQTP